MEIAWRVLPVPVSPSGTSPLLAWIAEYGIVLVLINIGIGGVLLFRAFPARYAVLTLLAYVPLMVLLIQFVGLAVAGLVFNDYL